MHHAANIIGGRLAAAMASNTAEIVAMKNVG
jgi:hypothetical protein